jgi:hypothetical protein
MHQGQGGCPKCHEQDWYFDGTQNGRVGKGECIVQPISETILKRKIEIDFATWNIIL